jgi:hypothetical protein
VNRDLAYYAAEYHKLRVIQYQIGLMYFKIHRQT